MKFKEINRMPVKDIDNLKSYPAKDKTESVMAIINFYKPQLQKCIDDYNIKNNSSMTLNEIKIDSGMHKSPHNLTLSVMCNVFIFYLDELYSNCGIVVSHKTNIYCPNVGIGTLLHAIKEDIAYRWGYSYIMYSDKNLTYNQNNKILAKVVGEPVFTGHNTRSYNKISVWVKPITDYYVNRRKSEPIIIKKELSTVETL